MNTEDKVKTYTLMHNGTTYCETNLKTLLETLRIEIEENCEFAPFDHENVSFDFEIKVERKFAQAELDKMPEFDGF